MPNNPTFNRSTQNGVSQGFHTRTLFSFTPYSLYDLELGGSGDWVSDSTWDGIGDLSSSYANQCFGTNILPQQYWRSGKTIRIHGTILADTNFEEIPFGGIPFNMKFGLLERGGYNIDWLAFTNNGIDHNLFNGSPYIGPVPIDFFCDITCCEIDFENDYIGFIAAGYFQYNDTDYDGGGDNTTKIYTPIYLETFSIGHDTTFYYNRTSIMFNLYGTGAAHVYITNLTIEELA
jgi:hypothetical protein